MNLFSIFKRDPDDSVVVAKIKCGFSFIQKVEGNIPVPYQWEAWLYENSAGKRWVKTSGNLKVDKTVMKSINEWIKHKIIIQVIPNWTHMARGGDPYVIEYTP